MKRILPSEKGSVSIFLIIITAAIFFFNAVLIDFARVTAAKKQTEQAVRAAVRSVLSAYDIELKEMYGLYGVNEEDISSIYEEVLDKNLTTSPGYFQFVDVNLENTMISYSDEDIEITASEHEDIIDPLPNGLWNHAIFERQMKEEMKYKAPINLTIDVVNKLSKLSFSLEQGSKVTNTLESISNDYDDRWKKIKQAEKEQEKGTKIINEKNPDTLLSIPAGYNQYISNIKNLDSLVIDETKSLEEIIAIEQQRKQLEEAISIYKSESMEKAEKLSEYYQSKQKAFNQTIDKAIAYIEEAERLNNIIAKEIGEVNQISIDSTEKTDGDLLNEKELVISEEVFSTMMNTLEKEKVDYQSFVSKLSTCENIINNALQANGNEVNKTIKKMNEAIEDIQKERTTIIEYGTSIGKNFGNINKTLDKVEKEKKDADKKTPDNQPSYNQLLTLFDEIGDFQGKQEEYQLVDTYFDYYLDLNNKNNKANKDNENQNYDAKDALGKVSKLFTDIENILEDFIDDAYVNEYVFERFNHFDPTSLEQVITYKKSDHIEEGDNKAEDISIDKNHLTDTLGELLSIQNQEIEYVIYGSDVPSGNIAKAFRDIFLIRLGINTLEGFSDPKVRAASHPLAILIGALIYGVTKSVVDMLKLIHDGEHTLSKYAKIPFTYKDYLRLIFLFHNGDDTKLSRIQALIHFNTDKNLTRVPTYIDGEITTSINLWFIPGVMRALNIIGVLDGTVEGNRYRITRRAVMAY